MFCNSLNYSHLDFYPFVESPPWHNQPRLIDTELTVLACVRL